MLNKYGTKVEFRKTDDGTYKLEFGKSDTYSIRIGDNSSENTMSYINLEGGPYISVGMELLDIYEELPDERIEEIIHNDTGIYIIT